MKKIIIVLFLFSCIVITFTTCIKDEFNLDKWNREVKYDASFAVPLAFGDLSYVDIDKFAGGIDNVIINDEGYLSLLYKTHVESFFADSLFKVGVMHNLFKIPALTKNTDVTQNWEIVPDELNGSTFLTGTKFKEMTLKSGNANIRIAKENGELLSISEFSSIHVIFPEIKINGNSALSFIFSNNIEDSQSLAGYTIDFSTSTPGYNKIPVVFHVNYSGTPPTGGVSIDVTFSNIEYSKIIGNFGQKKLMFKKDTIDVKIFKEEEYEINRYYFKDPKIKVDYENTFGVPSYFTFNELKAYTHQDIQLPLLTSTNPSLSIFHPDWHNVNYSTALGVPAKGNITINKENSNLPDIVSQKPRWIKFSATAATNNEQSDLASLNQFITDDSKLKADIEMELPLWGDMSLFKMKDTADFELPEYIFTYDPVKRAELVVKITNGFPAEMLTQVYFLDENNNILDELFVTQAEKVLSAAPVGAGDKVSGTSDKITYITVTNDKIRKWKTVKKIIYEVTANTTDVNHDQPGQLVKIYPENRVKFFIGLDFKVGIEGNIDSIQNAIENDTISNK
ncbi:MAG: hypothetical protein LBV69_05250 [Bacteroidales bacterium]|jgi:hypothetical protein|nr:hypothetical protein [Bacteroidales bacterium]